MHQDAADRGRQPVLEERPLASWTGGIERRQRSLETKFSMDALPEGEETWKALDKLIASRAREPAESDSEERRLRAQGRTRRAARRERNRLLWIDHYMNLAECLALRSAEYQRKAKALEMVE
jgi:hypothetical protein